MTTARPARLLAFDSGIGGLGIVAALRRHLPDASIDYLADTALFPYGEQEDATLVRHIVALLGEAISTLRPDAVVIACNTASTLALGALREAYPTTPFVGCVPPIRWAARISKTRTIGLLATRATVRRRYVAALREDYAPDCTLIAHGARHLADAAEAVFRGQPADHVLLARELDGLLSQPGGHRIDAVGIGCTHYTFLLDALRQVAPPTITWLDPADAVARQAATILQATSDRPLFERGESSSAASAGQAWFTAFPPDDKRVTAGLVSFGYPQLSLWNATLPMV